MTVLTIVLIGGVLTVSVLLVIRLAGSGPGSGSGAAGGGAGLAIGALPEAIALPAGARVVAAGRGAPGEILLVVEAPSGARSLLSVDAASGEVLDAAPLRDE